MHPSVGWQTFKLKGATHNTPVLENVNSHGFLWLDKPFFLDGRNFTPKEEYIIKKFISVYIPWVMLLPSWFRWYAILV